MFLDHSRFFFLAGCYFNKPWYNGLSELSFISVVALHSYFTRSRFHFAGQYALWYSSANSSTQNKYMTFAVHSWLTILSVLQSSVQVTTRRSISAWQLLFWTLCHLSSWSWPIFIASSSNTLTIKAYSVLISYPDRGCWKHCSRHFRAVFLNQMVPLIRTSPDCSDANGHQSLVFSSSFPRSYSILISFQNISHDVPGTWLSRE